MKKIILLKVLFLTVLGILSLAMVGCAKADDNTSVDGETFLAIDINPSIEFVLDENDEVISVSFNNDDAEIAASDIDFIGMNYQDAIDAFINAAVETGYIDVETTNNTVVITVGNDNQAREQELQQEAEETAQSYMEEKNIGAAILSGADVYDDLVAFAEQYEISIGKARMVKSAMAIDETLTEEEVTELPIQELMQLITNAHQEKMQAFAESKKQDALALKEEMVSQSQQKVDDFRTRVETGEEPTPDYDTIHQENKENYQQMAEAYQERANNMRNGIIQEMDPSNYMPDDKGSQNPFN
ncbi:MAG: hypothetical protein K9L74_05175 [Candidatus Izimaplasma sp.]|nr:hypothetical protein [Candidatus Izimaplasma bacterium]